MPENNPQPLDSAPINALPLHKKRRGQALVEYVLIVVLVSLAVIAAIAATGPAIGNVFSNTVYNLLEETTVPYATINATEFWKYVTAVASYTPVVPTIAVNTPIGQTSTPTPPPTSTGSSPTPSSTSTSTTTPTFGPSPTLVDQVYSLPFIDTAEDPLELPNRFHTPFYDAFAALPWEAGYFNGSVFHTKADVSTPYLCNDPSAGANAYSTTVGCESDVNYKNILPPPVGSLDSMSAVYFADNVPFNGQPWQIAMTIGQNDYAQFKIDGSVVFTISSGDAQPKTPVQVTPTAGNHSIEADYYTSGSAGTVGHIVKLVLSRLADEGSCAWTNVQSGHRSQLSWQDANNNHQYTVSSNCNLRLRGSIDLTTAVGTDPVVMTFYDIFSLNTNATAMLGIRDYASTTDAWTWVNIHNTGELNKNWQTERVDLSSFGGVNFLTTGSRKIEFAFRVLNADPVNTSSGWMVDDINIAQEHTQSWTIPVSDDFEGSSSLKWTPECNWAISQENPPAHSGKNVYSDSVYDTYKPDSNCSLDLNGVINMSVFTATNPDTPELVIYDQYVITGANTSTGTGLYVEYAPLNNRTSWTALTPSNTSNPYIARGNATHFGVNQWAQERFDLGALRSTPASLATNPTNSYFFRFRLKADATTPPSDGWYIDDVTFRIKPQTIVGIPFYEPFNNADNWTLSGSWGLTSNLDPVPHSAPYSLGQSPNGANYTSGTGVTYAQLASQINLASTTNPYLEFWSRWDTTNGVNLYVDGSIDNGTTWQSTALWSHLYGDTTTPAFAMPGGAKGNFDTDNAWTRYRVSLPALYVGKLLSLRLRMVVGASAVSARGWFVDDITVDETHDDGTYPVPFTDGFETGAKNWYVGGEWTPNGTVKHTGSASVMASNIANTPTYPNRAASNIELNKSLDMTGITTPVISFWTKYGINSNHDLAVEILPDGGLWSQLNWISATTAPGPTLQTGTNLGWTRQVMALPIGAVKHIRVRFRLLALTTDAPTNNWWLDDVYVGDLTGLPQYNSHTLPYQEDFEGASLAQNWVTEGDWQTVTDWGGWQYSMPTDNFTPNSIQYSPGGLVNSQWDVNYYHYYNGDPTFPVAGDVPAARLCGLTGGNQISNVQKLGSAPLKLSYASSQQKFSFSGGTPNANNTSILKPYTGIKVSSAGVGSGLKFTVPADTSLRTLKVYAGIQGATGTFTAALSDGSAAAYTDSSLTEPSGNSSNIKSGVYTLNYRAASAGQILTVSFAESTNIVPGNDAMILEAATLVVGVPLATPSLSGAYALTAAAATLVAVDLTAEGTADWAAWAVYSDVDYTHKQCVQSILHQSDTQVSHTWDSGHIPGYLPGVAAGATWKTDLLDQEYFSAVFTRQMTVNAGTYRFWMSADDGEKLLIDGVLQTPSTNAPTDPNGLPYPWWSGGTNGWQYQGTTSYFFYQITIASTGTHTFQVLYFQGSGGATLNFQVEEKSNVLHSNASGVAYTKFQDTAAYLTGYLLVPPAGTKSTVLTFNERYLLGSTSTVSDPVTISISVDGGLTWTVVQVTDTATGSNINYGYDMADAAFNAGKGVDPYVTGQMWHLHQVLLDNYITKTITNKVNIKFELNATASTNPQDGWYIDDVQVLQS